MTKNTRYFVITAGAILLVGVGGGLVAYLAYNRVANDIAGVPREIRYVPVDAEVVAFANVRTIMDSELRRALVPNIDPESRKGKQMMNDFAGVDLEKQVDHVVMFVEPFIAGQDVDPQGREFPRASLIVQGSFDAARIEQFVRERGAAIEEHRGQKLFAYREGPNQGAVGFVQPDVIAIGQTDLVRRTIDISKDEADDFKSVASNPEMMNLIRDNSGSTAWVVGQFDEISRRMHLPDSVSGQVPPVRLVAAKADIDGGVKATIRAEAGDKAAADQLRDVVRGFLSLARLHSSGKEDLEGVLKTIELGGTDTTVRLSFSVSPETLKSITPPRRGERRRQMDPPAPPIPPAPPK